MAKRKNSGKQTFLIVLGLAFLLTSIVFGLYFIKNSQLINKAAEQSETANWKTYTNNEYGFSLKYPTGFNIEDNSTNFPPFNITIKDSTKQLVGEGGGKFNPGIHIQVQSEKMSLDQYLSKYANSLIVRNKQKINGSEFTIIEATIGHARTFTIFN